MDIKKILLVSLIVVAIVASVSAVSAGWFDGLFGGEAPDNVIELDHIKFNMTNQSNVTEFELKNKSKTDAGYYRYYFDKEGVGYNVWIYNGSKVDNSLWSQAVKEFKNDRYDNVPSQTVNGVVIYTTAAGHGEHVGEPRFESIVVNDDLKTIVRFSTPDANQTANMTLSLKFK